MHKTRCVGSQTNRCEHIAVHTDSSRGCSKKSPKRQKVRPTETYILLDGIFLFLVFLMV